MNRCYYVLLNGEKITVSEEIYYTYYRPMWRERKQRVVRSDREFSYDFMEENNFDELCDETQTSVEEIVEDKMMSEMLMSVLEKLNDDERFLIKELFFNNKSERDLSKEICISQTTLNYQKNKIIKGLRKKLEK